MDFPEHIQLAQGNGGRLMRELIERLFARCLGDRLLDINADAARLPPLQPGDEARLLYSTDGFVVQPLEFPGGDIGSLAVHGTVNDLAVAGATPRYLSLTAILEEGLETALLERVLNSMAAAARKAGVLIAAGDTKVVPRGSGGGIYFSTTGLGVLPADVELGLAHIRTGDRILLSGPIGDHGVSVLLAREEFGLSGDLASDSASVLPLTESVRSLPGLRFMRDPTRGGLVSVLHEITQASGHGIRVDEALIPVRDPVRSVCELLGYDPYYLACEGRVVAVVEAAQADAVLARWRALEQGRASTCIGQIAPDSRGVILRTLLGGERYLEELEDDPLPRIC